MANQRNNKTIHRAGIINIIVCAALGLPLIAGAQEMVSVKAGQELVVAPKDGLHAAHANQALNTSAADVITARQVGNLSVY